MSQNQNKYPSRNVYHINFTCLIEEKVKNYIEVKKIGNKNPTRKKVEDTISRQRYNGYVHIATFEDDYDEKIHKKQVDDLILKELLKVHTEPNIKFTHIVIKSHIKLGI